MTNMIEKLRHPVDLATLDKDLEDIMINDYPGKMFGNQHYIDTPTDDKIYRFFNLEKNTLLEFLGNYKHSFRYEVLDSETGELIEVNKPKKAYSKPKIYSEPKITTRSFFLFSDDKELSKAKLIKDLFFGSN